MEKMGGGGKKKKRVSERGGKNRIIRACIVKVRNKKKIVGASKKGEGLGKKKKGLIKGGGVGSV